MAPSAFPDVLDARFSLHAAALAASIVALGCGASASSRAQASVPTSPDARQAERCTLRGSQSRPLVTEWPATERSRLESRSSKGIIVVAYAGCEMQVLDRCQADGAYRFSPTSVAKDGFTVSTQDDLYAKLPLGAAALEGELARAGSLHLAYVVVGQYDAAGLDPAAIALQGECEGATHLVAGYAVGAFTLASGGRVKASGGATVLGVGAGAAHEASLDVLRSGGDAAACEKGRGDASSPPEHCRTPIQLFLAALPGRQGAAPQAVDSKSDGPKPRDDANEGVRFLLHAGGGAVVGPDLRLDGVSKFDKVLGPLASGWLGLRLPVERNIDFQARGGVQFAYLSANQSGWANATTIRAMALCGDLTMRYRPSGGTFYAGAGVGGQILAASGKAVEGTLWASGALVTGEHSSTAFHGQGLGEAGWLWGDRREWDLGFRAGGGMPLTFDRGILFFGTLSVGRTLD